jgi:aryl-alcohol dehydrogenase-like predicted oxidoreductase
LGEALATFRDRLVIATRFGWAHEDPARWSLLNSPSAHIKATAKASLRRLGVDAIDLFYRHRVDPEVRSKMWREP